MPEGPQMVIVKEQAEQFVGEHVELAEGNAKDIPFDAIKDEKLIEIKTFGKELLFCFDGFAIRVHLMLFGKYAINSELNRLLRLKLRFGTGEINFYASECRFINEPLDAVYDWSIVVMHASFDRKNAMAKLNSKPKLLVCEALLDQHIFAGVGNKIKNEVLFRAQVHPESLTGAIPQAVLKKLINECVQLSFEYLDWKHGGTEDERWEVYRKKECPRDHLPIIKQKIGKSGRTSYFCDKCQVLYDGEGL